MKIGRVQIPEYICRNFNKYKYVLLVCLVGLLLAAWPSGQSGADEPASSGDQSAQFPQSQELEQSLEETLSQMDGVGRISVMLTIKSGYRSVYAYDSQTSESSRTGSDSTEVSAEKQQTMVFSGGNSQPVTVRTDGPQYQGAVIVCDGAGSAEVRLALTEAVHALTGIPSDCISILKMKQ